MNFVCYKYYTKRGDRVAIFGKREEDKLVITNIYCSVKDKFSKKLAREAYHVISEGGQHTFHPEIIEIPVQKWETAKSAFFNYCERRFFKRSTSIQMVDVLTNGRKIIYLKTKPKEVKW